ncbi:peptide chain release factor N(5)-glutamine methyltransferase [Sporomusa acidovorans]|uniref:Release factor glutamine methyltransferase n=1 Tax=Sporomusa acidovorans (strain ATCC 49682 / DSM 3132 / Mol) TaxID=1123286 RepID=A0ABZ3J7J2_SPOA4|nr:peptide chain release factor N(5)-glutamine methyltransferase [Sporomusa acidovorans]OZC21202.1 release factor glutamine methyltransferase [Sporomusa acidovorans DSM 3132]SDE64606.1 release factor glutamine methyltransferase [Sporomusa acidovorans]
MEQWTISSILNWTRQYFASKGIANPRLDAEVLLSHIMAKDRLHLYTNFDQPLTAEELAAYRQAVKRRVMRMPVAYINGHKEFMGLDFVVNPAVLIPRPDTEILVEAALARLSGIPAPAIADLGTGSGAIIVSLLANITAAVGTAVDISAEALAVARENAGRLGVAERLTLLRGDMLVPLAGKTFDALVANPPYIPDKDIAGLSPEVRQEPRLALRGGSDGLDFYRRLVDKGADYLNAGGFIAVEVGINQAGPVAALADDDSRLNRETIIKDYAGIERVVIFRLSI